MKKKELPRLTKIVLYVLLLIAPASWGGVFVVFRYLNEAREEFGITAWDIVWLRFIPSALLFMPLLWMRREQTRRILSGAFWPMLWVAILTTGVYNFLLVKGEERVPASLASLIVGSGPISTFLLSAFFLRERVTWSKVTGIALSLAGLVYISMMGRSEDGAVRWETRHLVFTLLAPIAWSIATVIGKRVLQDFDALAFTALSVVAGSLLLVPLPLFQGALVDIWSQLPAMFWAAVAYLVLLPTVFGYIVWYKALDYLEATEVAVFVFLVPVFGVLFSIPYEGTPGIWVLVGGALILVGVFLTNRSEITSK